MKLNHVEQGKGPALLLIHAFPLNHEMWAPQLGVLSKHFRIIAPDIRGFGGSQPPSEWKMEDAADDLNELLTSLGVTSCSVVGVSMGGYIAFPFRFRYPNRVRKLVLANTRARADNETEQAARNDMIAELQQAGSIILPDRMLPRLLKPNPRPEVVRAVRRMIEGANASAAAFAVMAMRDRTDFSTMLHHIDCPTMVVTGADVIIRVEDSRAVAEGIPGARFEEIPDSGHLSSLENPDDFNRVLLDFLR